VPHLYILSSQGWHIGILKVLGYKTPRWWCSFRHWHSLPVIYLTSLSHTIWT